MAKTFPIFSSSMPTLAVDRASLSPTLASYRDIAVAVLSCELSWMVSRIENWLSVSLSSVVGWGGVEGGGVEEGGVEEGGCLGARELRIASRLTPVSGKLKRDRNLKRDWSFKSNRRS